MVTGGRRQQNRMPLACDSAVEVVPSWEERGTQPPEGIVSVANKGLAGARFLDVWQAQDLRSRRRLTSGEQRGKRYTPPAFAWESAEVIEGKGVASLNYAQRVRNRLKTKGLDENTGSRTSLRVYGRGSGGAYKGLGSPPFQARVEGCSNAKKGLSIFCLLVQ